MHMSELFSQADLDAAISAGHVKVQAHPELPLRILNYTAACQWESAWTPVTRQCRGLILDGSDAVVARPFTKVHNHHEAAAPIIDAREAVIVTDKVDGSLGILYPGVGGDEIATRGSFASEQAVHATGIWRHRYGGRVTIPDGITPLFEIVYPQNRIVIDYGAMDDLVLLAGIQVETGRYIPPADMARHMAWTGPVTEAFPFDCYADVLAAQPRKDREGFVVRSVETGAMVKCKQADYVELHRIVTGLNARTVWERLGDGQGVPDLIADLPDEFHGWVADVGTQLVEQARDKVSDAADAHMAIVGGLPTEWTRKDYALIAKDHPLKAYLFLLLDERDPWSMAWRDVKPSADWRPSNLRDQDEDAA